MAEGQSRDEMAVERAVESLYRVLEFRRWVQSNVLFPTVPDTVVHPLLDHLREAEHRLLAALYDRDALDRVAAINRTLARPGKV
jgi:hypothetical protein